MATPGGISNRWGKCSATSPDGNLCSLKDGHKGQHLVDPDPQGLIAAGQGPVAIFSYPGRTQVEAGQMFQQHAATLASQGYRPVSQSWAEGRPGVGRVVALGVFASSIRPKGYLTVTYERQSQSDSAGESTPVDPLDQLKRLGELRDAGVLTESEFQAKKAEILARL